MGFKNSIRKTDQTNPGYVPESLIIGLKLHNVSTNRFNTKLKVWGKVNPDLEILLRLMDGLTADTVREEVAIVGIGDTGEDMGQIATEVKIAFPVSHNTLTIVEEYVQ